LGEYIHRDVSDLIFERGVEVSYQTIKDWNDKFAEQFVEEIRKRRPKPTRRWNVDEVRVKIRGKCCSHPDSDLLASSSASSAQWRSQHFYGLV